MNLVSVILPIGPKDFLNEHLIGQLRDFAAIGEFILVATREPVEAELQLLRATDLPPFRWMISNPGRASQLNMGAEQAQFDWLWFVHVDSQFDLVEDRSFLQRKKLNERTLYYFDLKFDRHSPALMRINEFGVRLRSHQFKMPFGDQALLIHSQVFKEVGGFDSGAAYGEDHLLVWGVRKLGCEVESIGETIITSARKYVEGGWLKTTGRHVFLTYRQAIPAYLRHFRRTIGE